MEKFASVLRELQILIALLLAAYFALKTNGPERIALISSALAVVTGLVAR